MNLFCLLIVAFCGMIDDGASIEITACYGNFERNFLLPNCSTGQILKVSGLYALAKKIEINCPAEYTVSSGDPEKCCTYSGEDCKMEYSGVSEYFIPCVALNSCNMIASWQDTTCNGTFMPRSNYMLMDYTCISIADILPVTSNQARNGPPSMIGGPGYPVSSLPANTDGICSVSSSCITTINVIALDLALQADGGGTCQQFIDIEESGSSIHRIDCADNNLKKKPRVLYTSQTGFLILRYRNTLSTDAGRLWVEFNGTHENATIDIKCGTSILTSPPLVPDCLQTTSSPTTASPTSTSDGPTQGGGRGRSQSPGSSPGSSPVPGETLGTGGISGIVLGILALLIILLLVFLLWRYKKKKTGKMSTKVSASSDLLPNDAFAEALGLNSKPPVVGAAPVSSTLGSRPPRLTPIETTKKDPVGRRNAWDTSNTFITPTSSIVKNSSPVENGASQPKTMKTSVFEIPKD